MTMILLLFHGCFFGYNFALRFMMYGPRLLYLLWYNYDKRNNRGAPEHK